MLLRKIVLSFGLVWLIQFNGSAQIGDSVNKALVLERVIYHAGKCNGSCPTIDMIIDSNREVYVRRTLWTAKGKSDKAHSGNFKGKIDRHTYFNLFAELVSSHYAGLQFPVDFCCDASIKTIIVYANGKRTKLSSMTPPKDALKLIAFLQGFGIAATTSAHDRRLGDRTIAGIAIVAVEGICHIISIGEGKINARNILNYSSVFGLLPAFENPDDLSAIMAKHA